MAGCIETYQSSCVKKLPEPGETLAPWVQITIQNPSAGAGSGGSITVGNRSFPSNPHTAVIKSFEFGKADSLSCRVVVHDEQGGSFVKFAEALLKDYKCAKPPFNMKVEWGWVKTNCGAPASPRLSKPAYMIVGMMETNFTGGKFQYEITGTEVFSSGQEGGSEEVIGGDGDEGVYLRDAIEQYLTEEPPPIVGKVKFCKVVRGNCVPVAFEEGEKTSENGRSASWKGPKGKWQCQGQDKLRTVVRWLEGWRSENKKAFVPFYNDESADGEVIFWEDPKPQCSQNSPDEGCVGFYLVNGGKESPVIEFNPSFKWDFAMLTNVGGNTSVQTIDPTDNNAKTKGRDECPTLSRTGNPGAGHGMSTPQSENHDNRFGQGGTEKNREAQDAMFRALRPADMIEADLVLVGDPSIHPLTHYQKPVSIAFINPFHLLGASNAAFGGATDTSGIGSCGEWLALPLCNPVLSNDKWQIKSITHRIEAGKYTTTLRVYLAVPGVDLDTGQNLGGSALGWKPPAGCPS